MAIVTVCASVLSCCVYGGNDTDRAHTRHGFRIQIDVSDWLGRHVYVTGEYEPPTTRLITHRLARGSTFVDVGANVGYFTLLGAKCVGGHGKVYSFEPLPAVRRRLEENIQMNQFSHCEVHALAASNVEGTREFFVGPRDHLGVSSLRRLEDASETLTVQTATLDEVLPLDIQVALIKIDVEGSECHVLEGMQAILARSRPDIILEVTPEYLANLDRSPKQIEELLGVFGYRPFAIEHTGLRPLSSLDEAAGSQFNALFTVRH